MWVFCFYRCLRGIGGSLPAGRQGSRPTPLQKPINPCRLILTRVFFLGSIKRVTVYSGHLKYTPSLIAGLKKSRTNRFGFHVFFENDVVMGLR
jgi:hypothetical protein